MKSKHVVLGLMMLAPFGILFADDLPKAFAFARYQAMMDRSPFAVATAVAVPSATPNFAKDLYVANAAHSKDGDFVTIASSADKNFKKYLSTSTSEDGYSITNIEWSDKIGATKVTISKDGQLATLTFNEALLKQSAAPNVQPQAPQPNVQPQPIVPPPTSAVTQQPTYQQMKPAPIPQLPSPPPRVRGVIPKNPVPNTTPYPSPGTAGTPEPQL